MTVPQQIFMYNNRHVNQMCPTGHSLLTPGWEKSKMTLWFWLQMTWRMITPLRWVGKLEGGDTKQKSFISPMLCLNTKRRTKGNTKRGQGITDLTIEKRRSWRQAEGSILWRCWKCRVKGIQEAGENSDNVQTKQVEVWNQAPNRHQKSTGD